MNYKAVLFVMVGIAFLMSGCKAYSGYRNFTENVEIEQKMMKMYWNQIMK